MPSIEYISTFYVNDCGEFALKFKDCFGSLTSQKGVVDVNFDSTSKQRPLIVILFVRPFISKKHCMVSSIVLKIYQELEIKTIEFPVELIIEF